MIHLFSQTTETQPARIDGKAARAAAIGVCLYPDTEPLLVLETPKGFRFFDLPVEAFAQVCEGGNTPARPIGAWTWTEEVADVLICTRDGEKVRKKPGRTYGMAVGVSDNVLWILAENEDGLLGWFPPSRLQYGTDEKAPLPTWKKARGAAVALIMIGGYIAAVRRPEGWGLPGGKIEAGETSWDAMCREVGEEIGMGCGDMVRRLADDALVDTQYVETTEVTCYLFVNPEGEMQPCLEPGEDEYPAEWITLRELVTNPAFPVWLRRLLAPRNLNRLLSGQPRARRQAVLAALS